MSFLEELAKKGIINESQIGGIKDLANKKHEGDIEGALSEVGISEDEILNAKGEYFSMPIKKIDAKGMSFVALKYIPEDSAKHYNFAPFALADGVLEVGVTDPSNI